MTYESTIRLSDGESISVHSDDDGAWLFLHLKGVFVSKCVTAEKARNLAAALLDAAEDLEPTEAHVVGSVA